MIPLSDLKDQLDAITRSDSFLVHGNSVESFVDFDNDVQSSNGVMTEEEMLKEVIGDDDLHEDPGLWLCQRWTRFPYLECLMVHV